MLLTAALRTAGHRRRAASPEPRGLVVFAAVVIPSAILLSLWAFAHGGFSDGRQWFVVALLGALALGFEEGSRRVGRLRIRLSADLKRDMTSVWSVAGTVALSASLAVLLHVVLFAYLFVRQERPAGQRPVRRLLSRSTSVLGCLAAGAAMRSLHGAVASWPHLLVGAFGVVVVIVVHTLVNRSLISVGLLTTGAPLRALVGTADDNMMELATLCLGGLVALAALYEPLLCILVLPPMISMQRSAMVRELETVATTDSKTGLLNAVAIEHVGQREVERAQRASSSLAILIIDIDRFKTVNDRFGHLVGDTVLRGVGRALERALREYDSVGRFGGEEFVAVLPGAEEFEALVVAERLRSHVARLTVQELDPRAQDGDTSLSVSIGVACFREHGTAMSELLFAADAALYRAKATGRNRVILAEVPSGEGSGATVASA